MKCVHVYGMYRCMLGYVYVVCIGACVWRDACVVVGIGICGWVCMVYIGLCMWGVSVRVCVWYV